MAEVKGMNSKEAAIEYSTFVQKGNHSVDVLCMVAFCSRGLIVSI